MSVSLSRANEELSRGIDEQSARFNTWIVVTGVLTAASVASTSQMLATSAASTAWRWAAVAGCAIATTLSLTLWLTARCYDIDPVRRLDQATENDWSDDDLMLELFVVREIAYRQNERQLSGGTWLGKLYVAAVVAASASAIWSLLMMVGSREGVKYVGV